LPPSFVSPQTPSKEPEEKKENGPIAQNNGLPSPRFPAPNIRGENSENKEWKALLNQVWYTDYPMVDLSSSEPFSKADQSLRTRDFNTAYVQLQRLERKLPENDTLQFLKGYCLLEMGEGAEALRYFSGLEQEHADWSMRLDWYRGLAQLLQGDKQTAKAVFEKIAATPTHTYRKQAGRARQLLK
ncbi:MAG: hypothetical protein H7246_04690, partial [Phycisphaerae bacterium]|nr:hypothetical protein [Saprospiraceae bacterium]